jgi:RNA polymerase sigma-70 factor (ECF subfamily)
MPVSTSDDALIAAAQAGDSGALDLLLRRHYDRIWALCRRLAGNHADAEDATQEALMAVARGLRGFDGRAAFTTWSYRVATNACLDELRRRARRPALLANDDDVGAATVDRGPRPEQVVDRIDIDGALAQLPDDFRVAVVLRDLCDLEYADIAQVLGLPAGTVRSRIARGRAQLARCLGNPDPSTERPTSRP